MQLGIYPVGFPDLKKVQPVLAEIYRESIKKDQETLLDLIISAKKVLSVKDLFDWRPRTCTLL